MNTHILRGTRFVQVFVLLSIRRHKDMESADDDAIFCAKSPLFDCVETDSEDSSFLIDDGYVAPLKSMRSSNNFTGFGSMDPIVERRSICSLPPHHARSGSVANDTRLCFNEHPKDVPVAALPPAKSTFSLGCPLNFDYDIVDFTKLNMMNDAYWRHPHGSASFKEIADDYFKSSTSTFLEKLWNALQLSQAGYQKDTGVGWRNESTVEVQTEKFVDLLGLTEVSELEKVFDVTGFRELTGDEVEFGAREGHKYFVDSRNIFKRNGNVKDIERMNGSYCGV